MLSVLFRLAGAKLILCNIICLRSPSKHKWQLDLGMGLLSFQIFVMLLELLIISYLALLLYLR